MNIKNVKKFVAFVVAATFALSGVLPALAQTPTPTPVVIGSSTGLQRGAGGGMAPIVKAKWEMKTGSQGQDNSIAPGAQFNASGVYNVDLTYTVCAIVTDPNGTGDISGVYADIFYPNGVGIHDPADDAGGQNHPNDIHVVPDTGLGDHGIVGTPGRLQCDPFKEQNTLVPMETIAGYNLFCNSIQSNNNNLPTFSNGYTYGEICGSNGELMKQTALVYCDAKTLSYEDPAGLYTVQVSALDKGGNSSNVLSNQFEYLPLTAFEKDFTNVDYGQVMLGQAGDPHKKILGDQTFGTANLPTIRNIGNTRLWMWVAQDDMGLGKTSGNWNVSFDARVGNNPNDWVIYGPFGYKPAAPVWSTDYTKLADILDLSETEQVDFSILVTKWPDANQSYGGNMYLSATAAPQRDCPS